MTEDQKRRVSDTLGDKIEDLILAATEPKDKAFLLILNKIADNLDENTQLTRTLSSELKIHTVAFAQHEKDELALINQGRGFLRASVVLIAFVQVVMGYVITQHLASHKAALEEIKMLSEFKAAHTAHHDQEEKYSHGPKVQK